MELGGEKDPGHWLGYIHVLTLHDRLDVDETGSGRPLQAEELVPGYGHYIG